MMRTLIAVTALTIAGAGAAGAKAGFDLTYQIENSSGLFTENHLLLLAEALASAETTWETAITGYAMPEISLPLVIRIWPTTTGLASGIYNGVLSTGVFEYATGGDIFVNFLEIENFANWQGPGANGLNMLDELLVHETGHVLGIGTLWVENGVYVPGSFEYTGAYGLAAYRLEFDLLAEWIPVESAGDIGTADSHWNQRMRSSFLEGNPIDPWSLDPRVGIVDSLGRDLALEIMTGAIDPDYGEPFLSRTTIESMRDLGYTVARFEDANHDGVVDATDMAVWIANFGSVGLPIDSIARGDANRDRAVGGGDFLLWQQAFGNGANGAVPEPSALVLFAVAFAGVAAGAGYR